MFLVLINSSSNQCYLLFKLKVVSNTNTTQPNYCLALINRVMPKEKIPHFLNFYLSLKWMKINFFILSQILLPRNHFFHFMTIIIFKKIHIVHIEENAISTCWISCTGNEFYTELYIYYGLWFRISNRREFLPCKRMVNE